MPVRFMQTHALAAHPVQGEESFRACDWLQRGVDD